MTKLVILVWGRNIVNGKEHLVFGRTVFLTLIYLDRRDTTKTYG